LRLAGLLPHIDSLDEKLHHKLSRAGSELSGGQRQKLGIARALLDKPQLLVLDEASSSLDQESEDYLNNTIESLKGKVTIIMIAHRLTTIRNLDQVILMEKGRLVAQGKFEELVRTNQLFSDFVRYSQIK
jgi:ATP-binding cassette subfamily C protein